MTVRDEIGRTDLSRRWEIELLISGATLFALLQAPGVVDRWYTHAQPHLDGGGEFLAFFGFYYAKLILYTLISTFLLHLFARAYWVGLVGLDSVYPKGVRWSEARYGPAFTEQLRRKLPTTTHSIRRMDDVSSLLFSGGSVILLMFVTSLVVIGPMAGLALLLSSALFGGEYLPETLVALVIAVSMIPVAARSLDLRWGRQNPGATPPASLRRAATASYYVGVTPIVGPLSLVLSTNLGRRSAATATTLVFVGIIGLFVVRDVLLQRGALRFDHHAYLPDAVAAQETLPAHYADQRDPGAVYPQTPFIQSQIVVDPYVRLFVPLTPERHNPLVAERCPSLQPGSTGLRLIPGRALGGDPPDISAYIACVAALQPVSLDGAPLHDLPWRLATDPASGLRGLLVHVPVRELAAGEHMLRIEGLPRPERERRDRPDRAPHIIRFWN